ncbi:hypothetical protein K503DRAFT_81999 [Rhizopogon vinicolor AM-OR11-026]|uniref:Uncharacterized protein n=1 Tax=Rhizopogon vinicolor AM-OR11-026 TaxID=1314800 RepID=A0A1B7MFU8_9AGAM|nr:hypothetical protein K503DRAFT_81999 [Rhizopogon vinicolor AM-OR11-026]
MIRFYVVLKTDLFFVRVSGNAKIREIIDFLQSKSAVAHRILGGISDDQYEYYKLKNPVSFSDDDRAIADVVKDCLDQNNWQEVSPLHFVKGLAPMLSDSHVHLVIQPRAGKLPIYPLILD